jgi:hypothetical protein
MRLSNLTYFFYPLGQKWAEIGEGIHLAVGNTHSTVKRIINS